MTRNLKSATGIVPLLCLIVLALVPGAAHFAPQALAAGCSQDPGSQSESAYPVAPAVTRGNAHDECISTLNIPNLIGTQMSNAAILSRVADGIITGRRKAWSGAAGVQTHNPQSPPIQFASTSTGSSTTFLPIILSGPAALIRVSEGSVTLNEYPYETFQHDVVDPTYNITYKQFDANVYNQSPHITTPRNLKTVVIANDFLELTFLPELGGRLWQVLFKPTGQTLFYNNAVLKPSPWGPVQQGGWLAVGGMEWALPIDEHGYEWGVPWSYTIVADANQVTITFTDSQANDRVRALVSVTLPANAAYFTVHPRIENPTGAATHLQFWVNAMLALNSKNVSPATEFVFPSANALVHYTGDSFIPAANVPASGAQSPAEPLAWPVVAGRDLSRYANWSDYLGVFAAAPESDFAGAYNHANDFGVARVSARNVVSGTKLFAFGPNFGGRQLFADDGSDYLELWSGLPRTFFRDDDVTLAAGEAREWDEYWIPFAQTGGLSAATREAVLYLNIDTNRVATIGAAATMRDTNGDLVLLQDGVEAARWSISLSPGNPFQTRTSVGNGTSFRLRFIAPDGTVLAETL